MKHQVGIQGELAHQLLAALWREVLEHPAVRQVLSSQVLYLLDDYAEQFGEGWPSLETYDDPSSGATRDFDPRYPTG